MLGTAGRTPAEGLSYPYPANTDQFPGFGSTSDDIDHTYYAVESNHAVNTRTLILDLMPLVSAIYFATASIPLEDGSYDGEVTAEIKDAAGTVTNRATCAVTGGLTVTTDGGGFVTSATGYATCADVEYEKVSSSPVIDCNSQRIVKLDNASVKFTEFIRLYPDAISGSGVNVPACIGRIQVIS